MINDFMQQPRRRPVKLAAERSFGRVPRQQLREQRTPKIAQPAEDSPMFVSTASITPPIEQPSHTLSPSDLSTATTVTNIPISDSAIDSQQTAEADKPKTIKLFRRWEVPRKKFIIILIVLVVLLGGGGTAFALTHSSKPVPKKTVAAVKATVSPKPVPAQIVSPLTGLPVTAAQRDMPVTGVMIENSSDARPQSGLKDAGVVYEAIAEAGITRFLALYQEAEPANVGPIRSARPYFIDWAVGFDASYAHVGGSPEALQLISSLNVKDLDQSYNPDYYHRITTRDAPHNVYTSLPQLLSLEQNKGYDTSTFSGFVRKAEDPYKAPTTTTTTNQTTKGSITATTVDQRTPASSIDFAISGAYYNVHYDYDASANDYKRSEGGAPHIDADSNTQLAPKVAIALIMPYSLEADGYHSQYGTIGSGKMYVFQDGTVETGTWSKTSPQNQFVFTDGSGKTLALDPGQTWITVVGDASDVTYK